MIRPFPSWLVRSEHAESVVSPPYDAVGAIDRQTLIEQNSDTFLRVTRSPEDRPGPPVDLDTLAAESSAALADLLARDRFVEHPEPSLYVYELADGDHHQTGIVGDFPVVDYESGRIRVHERTHSAREDVLAHNLEHVRVSSSPVLMAHRRDPELAALLAAAKSNAPDLDFVAGGRLGQRVWRLDDPGWIRAVAAALDARTLYIVDGHHRCAASALVRRRRPEESGFATFLGAAFADDELSVLAFHRIVVGALDRLEEVLAGAAVHYTVAEADGPVDPTRPGEIGLVGDGRWWRLAPRLPEPGALDVALLQRDLLGPVLGIDDPAATTQLEYVPGVGGLDRLVARVAQTDGLGFTVRPASVHQLMHEADAGRTLPPKSTYFHPKARSGIFLRMR